MAQIRIEFISDGFKQILTSSGCQDLVSGITTEIKDRANTEIGEDSEGFYSNVMLGNYGGGRYIGFVGAADAAAMQAEAEDKILSKAVM